MQYSELPVTTVPRGRKPIKVRYKVESLNSDEEEKTNLAPTNFLAVRTCNIVVYSKRRWLFYNITCAELKKQESNSENFLRTCLTKFNDTVGLHG